MELILLFEGQLRYTSLEFVRVDPDGYVYGTLEGFVSGDRLAGRMRLTNFAPQRADNVYCPRLRGLFTTEDGAIAYVEMDGISVLRTSDEARVFTTSLTFRTGETRYAWLNTSLGLIEGVLDTADAVARLRAFECRPTI